MNWSLALMFTTLPAFANGQWSLGGFAHTSLNERAREAEYGTGARISFAPTLRFCLLADAFMDIPRRDRWDNSYGARGALSAGIAPFTRRQGEQKHFQEGVRLGVAWRIGRIHRRVDRAYCYWGVSSGFLHQASRYRVTITDLTNGTKSVTRGTTDHFYLRIGPVCGFRSREGNGRFYAEVVPFIQRTLDERTTAWELRYAAVIGYLWRLGS
ncbi:MAG: hypothetical protein JNM62_12750 [Flavobacteriales bacterium]|nr:hypothetical protein [Flavobacteriales bacterium]